MKRRPVAPALLTAALALALPVTGSMAAPGGSRTAAPLPGTTCTLLPADNVWHADISALPASARSAEWLGHMAAGTTNLHPDFGPAYGAQPVPYGIPVTVVGAAHRKVAVSFDYASESDRIRYPLGSDTRIEGGPGAGGDRHALVVDSSICRLYETFATARTPAGWHAGSGAVYDLASDALRPVGWTSADAAGLPILPGLLRLDEVRAGSVDHAIRFTTNVTDRSYLWPARHSAGSVSDPSYPPMGARFRLSATYSLAGLRPDTQAVLRAMQHYGLILADNGSPWFFGGLSQTGWPSALLDELKAVPASAFTAVDESGLMVDPDSGRVAPPG